MAFFNIAPPITPARLSKASWKPTRSRAWFCGCTRWAACRCASRCRAIERSRKTRQPLFSKRKVSQQQLLQFTHELGTLLTAGLPLDRSLSILGGLIEGERV